MRDPFPIPPPRALVQAIKPLADSLSLSSLPLHAHEVLFAFAFYITICSVVSPFLSARLVPKYYNRLDKRGKLGWDVHVVSFVQSVIICALSLYIILADEERKTWRRAGAWDERIWAYSGMTGLCQSFALGYFLWDLFMCIQHLNVFGWGMLAHAICAVSVFALGYRPFIYFYAPVFLLYELSSPFLNIHWFCDKLDLTGSIYQAVNGAFLTSTFFCCRIVWGLYSSYHVFHDMYLAIQAGHSQPPVFLSDAGSRNRRSADISLYYDQAAQKTAFMGTEYLPLWLAASYLTSNVVLNLLNLFWFGKMIETIRKRFDPPWGTKDVIREPAPAPPAEKVSPSLSGETRRADGKGSVRAARQKAEAAMNGPVVLDDAALVQRGVFADGHKSVEVSGSARSVRSRRKA